MGESATVSILVSGRNTYQPIVPTPPSASFATATIFPAGAPLSLSAAVEEAERLPIRIDLSQCDNRLGKTADLLGVSRKTLWEKMKCLDIRV